MTQFRFATALIIAAALTGCATDGPATNGASLRAAIASQVIAPQPRQTAGMDGAAAVEIYRNYVDSFDSPRPQVDDSAFRK